MKELRKEIEKLVENEDFVSYEEFIYELNEEKEEVKKYLDWRASGGKMNTETLPDGYVISIHTPTKGATACESCSSIGV